MGWLINLIAVVVSLLGLLIALGHDGYLAMLTNVARKRPGGEPVAKWVQGRVPVAAGTTLGAIVALLLTNGGVGTDLLGLVLGAGSGIVAYSALDTTRKRLSSR
jgi:hypothetical protein